MKKKNIDISSGWWHKKPMKKKTIKTILGDDIWNKLSPDQKELMKKTCGVVNIPEPITLQDLIAFEECREQENKKRYKNKLKYEHQEYHKNHMSELETREIPDTISEFIKYLNEYR